MIDLILQQRADLGIRLGEIGILVNHDNQTFRARHGGQCIERLVKTTKRHASNTNGARKYRLTKAMQVCLCIGTTSLKVNSLLALDELCDKTRFAHATAAVNHRHLKGARAIQSIELGHFRCSSDKHRAILPLRYS